MAHSADEIRTALTHYWTLGDFAIEPYGRGMGSNTWCVRSSRGTFVAKAVEGIPQFRRGLEVATAVEAAGIPAGAPIPTAGGDLVVGLGGGRELALLSFVPAEPITTRHARAWGATLARAHHAVAGREDLSDGLEQLPVINLNDESLNIQAWIRPTIEPVVDEVMSYRGPCVVLHGDPAQEAFLVDDRDRVGIIDWASVWYGPVLYDIASLQMYAGGNFAEVLLGYLSVAPEIESELKHLALFWRFRWSIQAAYFAWRIANDVMTGIDDRSENDVGLNDAKRNLGG